jgi:hypothetical protein
MFHLRPNRSFRSAVLHFSAFTEGYPPNRPISLIGTLHHRIDNLQLSRRKRVAISALLLASLLEFCGCNPVLTCYQLRSSALAHLQRNALVDRCRPCLTAHEFSALERALNPPTDAALYRPADRGMTVGQAVEDDEAPSFYDPEPSPSSESSEFPQSSETSYTPATQLLPSDPKLFQWPIPESVFFLYKNLPDATVSGGRISTATAFVLSVPGDGRRPFTRFLVTARHVVDPEWAHCAGPNPLSIQIRLNKRFGGVGYESIPLESNHAPRFFTASDSTSDLAVLELDQQLIPRLDQYKFIDIPFAMLPTPDEMQTVQTTQQIMTAGLRSREVNDLALYPELHPGILATMPAAPIDIRCGTSASPRPLHMWFISATGPQGASGAPVYTLINRDPTLVNRERGKPETPVLLGIQSVAWPERGLAGITPSAVLADLIRSALSHDRQPTRDTTRNMDVSIAASQ